MINSKLIYKILGSLLFLESIFMTLCLGIAIGYKEDDILSFAMSILITLTTAFTFRYIGRHADNILSRRDAFMVVTLLWIVFSTFGSLPYIIGGYIPNVTNAIFETISGFTTTGATILDDVECLPHGILFWRSFTQWIGGLGIVFFTVAILPSLVGGSVKVFAAESTGPIKSKLHPRLSTSAQSIWVIFLSLTIACFLSYKALGMGWFDSINHAMTTAATGGFSTHNASVKFLNSPTLEYVSTFYCFLAGINFMLLYRFAIKREFKSLLCNNEVKFYVCIVGLFTLFITIMLMNHNGYALEPAFRSAVFQVISFTTTTGYFNDDAGTWPVLTWVPLAICMFMGGCAGSTSGGFKSIRCLMLLKGISNEFKQMLHPKAVLPLKVGGTNITLQRRVTLLSFLSVYLIIFIISSFCLAALGIDSTNALTLCLSSLGNVGPTMGSDIGPTMSWNTLPDCAKWICSILMLLGRLEIFSILVIFTPQFWKE